MPVFVCFIERCAPGDGRDHEAFVFVAPQGTTRRQVLKVLFLEFVPALFGSCPRKFPRSRWTGAVDGVRQIGLPSCIHNLFADAFDVYMRGKDDGPAAPEVPAAPPRLDDQPVDPEEPLAKVPTAGSPYID